MLIEQDSTQSRERNSIVFVLYFLFLCIMKETKKGVIGLENYLGRKLKEYREQHLLTRKQLGDILCVSDKTISKWERGAGLPDIGTLKHLSQLLQIPLDDLLNEKEAPFIMNTKVN